MRLRNALFIGRNDFRFALRGKEALVWIFVMPPLFVYFIGTVTGGSGMTAVAGGGSSKRPLALQVGVEPGFLLEELERRLDEDGFKVTRTSEPTAFAGASLRMQVPAHFTERVLAGEVTTLEVGRKKASLAAQVEDMRMNHAVYTVLADVVAAAEDGKPPTPETFSRLGEATRALTMSVAPAGHRKKVPTGFEQAIPGILIMFTMIVLLTTGTSSLIVERRAGLLRRLASAPISRGEIVLGKWLGRLGLGLVQVAVAVLFGSLVFDMDWGPDFLMVGVVLVVWAAFCASLGLLLGNLAKTEAQGMGLGVLLANGLAGLGGCWWPIEFTGPGMQQLASWLPTGWAMSAMHDLISYRAGASAALGSVTLLLGTALVFGWIAARRFRFE